MASKKESQLTTATTFVSGDLVTGLRSAGNVNFSYSALFNAMSGLSTLNQVGDPLGVPTLDQPAAGVNNFRNIESSKGVIASVSAQNGINIAANFTQAASGTTLIADLNAAQYKFKTLKPGSDIALADDGESITISFASGATSLKTVVVAQESDFPTPVAGVITLASDTDYFMQADISTANRFIAGTSTTLRGPASQIVKLTYTGSAAMFTGVNPNFRIDRVTVACPNGDLFDMTSPLGSGILQMVEANVESCDTGGTVDGQFICRIKGVAWEDIKTTGITFTGAGLNLVYDTGVVFLNGGSYIDLGTATFSNVSITNQVIQTSAGGTTFLSGAASSANINAGGLGSVFNNRIFGSAATLSGISEDDALWNFSLNNNIPDTRPDGLLSMQGNAVNTVIASATVPVLVAGTWVAQRESQMTGTTAGRITYDGGKDATLPVTSSVTVQPVSGGSITVSACIAVDGVAVPASLRTATASSSSAASITVPWQDSFSTAQYVEVWVANEDSTVDLLVSSAVHRVN